MRVAKRWGLNPRQWREQSVDDQALMMSFEMFCDTRDAYRDDCRRKNKDKSDGAENEYDKLKRLMKIK